MSKTAARRGWEKGTTTAATPSTSVAPTTSVISLDTVVAGFSEHEKNSHRHAFLHLMQSLAGTSTDIETIDKRTLQGTFYTATPFRGEEQKIVMKATRMLKNGVADSEEPLSTVVTNMRDIVVVKTAKLNLQAKNYNHEFATDSTIKKYGDMSALDGRELQFVSDAWLDPSTDTNLGTSTTTPDGKQWDQFESNRRLFNVKSSFDENLYTKKLDMSKMTREQIARAESLAREIETTMSSNIHMKQERGQAMEEEISEEDLFSGVLTKQALPVKENPWIRGAKIIKDNTGTVSPKSGKTASSPLTKAGKGREASAAAVSSATASPTKQPMVLVPPNLPLPPLRPVTNTKPLPGLSPSPVTAAVELPPLEPVENVKVGEETAPAAAVAEIVAPAAESTPVVPPAVETKTASKLNASAKEFVFVMKATAPAWTPAAKPTYPPIQVAPMTPGMPVVVPHVVSPPQVVPQTPPQPIAGGGMMNSSPVVTNLNTNVGGFNNQFVQGNVQGNAPGSDFKSPAQPVVAQSPSGGPMLMPGQMPPYMYPMQQPENFPNGIPPQYLDPNILAAMHQANAAAGQPMQPWMMPNGMPGVLPQGGLPPMGMNMPGGVVPPPVNGMFPPAGVNNSGMVPFPFPNTPGEMNYFSQQMAAMGMQQPTNMPPFMMPPGEFQPPMYLGMPQIGNFNPQDAGVGFGPGNNPLMNQQLQLQQQQMLMNMAAAAAAGGQGGMFMPQQQPGFAPFMGNMPPHNNNFHQHGNPAQMMGNNPHQQQQQQQQQNNNNNQNSGGDNRGNNNFHNGQQQHNREGGGGGGYNKYSNNNEYRNNNSGGRGGRGYSNYNNNRQHQGNYNSYSNNRGGDRGGGGGNNSQPGTPNGREREHGQGGFGKDPTNNTGASAASTSNDKSNAPEGDGASAANVNANIGGETMSTPSK